ncbi:hypothetical protein SAMN04489761_0243 [Tenacibaculum sp. MAR_2009_124]|uniref:hypothetical protein n=1 Tax=Tenacibaculum sp. MAR_2009_124 TaxID=1250059 RepID=UPI000895F485|nr:hypothetical protein [Tenacibaculum sp. MAR_2009_124]SEB37326.1 hypothetical protein SAMN04489761_0243 [Tenacibaculum sp. MAR_2009_124]
MVSDYTKIFQLKVSHSYYDSGVCDTLIYEPSNRTKEIFNRYQFKTNIGADGLSLFFLSKNDRITFLNYIMKTTGERILEYTVSANEQFYQVTQWPDNKRGYFNTITSSIKNNSDSNELIKSFKEANNSGIVAKITLNIEDLLNNPDVDYVLKFNAKSTQLSYAFINNSGKHFKKLYIQSIPEMNFFAPYNIVLENGQKAICFISENTEIQLSQTPKYQLNLYEENEKLGTKRKQVVFKGLPHPNPSVYEIVKQENIIRSLMYVYI